MAEPISRFRQRYPGVELKIAEFGGLTVQQAVSNGERYGDDRPACRGG